MPTRPAGAAAGKVVHGKDLGCGGEKGGRGGVGERAWGEEVAGSEGGPHLPCLLCPPTTLETVANVKPHAAAPWHGDNPP